MFPVGNLMKPDVKRIADDNGFGDLAKKQEVSEGLSVKNCFCLEYGHLLCWTKEEFSSIS